MKKGRINIKIIAAFIGGIIATIFVLQNTEVVSIRFLFWQMSMSRVLLLPILILTGFVAGFFFGKYYHKS